MLNATDALWPPAAAVTVAVAGVLTLSVAGGKYVVSVPLDSRIDPGPVNVQVVSLKLEVIVVGPLIAFEPDGEMMSGTEELPQAQGPVARDTTVARSSARMDPPSSAAVCEASITSEVRFGLVRPATM